MVLCLIWHFFPDCVSPKGAKSVCKEKKKKTSVKSWEWISPTVCGRPLNITFVALFGKKNNISKEKNAIGKLLMAMKTLTHLCETVLLIEWRHPRCQCSKILSTHYFQMAHCGPTTEPNKNLIKPSWWRKFDDDEKVSFISDKPSGTGSFPKLMHWATLWDVSQMHNRYMLNYGFKPWFKS